jgi:hypothetical protein
MGKFEPGFIPIIVAIIIFYLRIMQLRGRKKRLERENILAHMREANKKKGKVAPLPPKDPSAPPFKVTSWPLAILSLLFMLAGVAGRSSSALPQLMQDLWWAPTTIGLLIFTFCFKVE